jgi:hypothetical protein
VLATSHLLLGDNDFLHESGDTRNRYANRRYRCDEHTIGQGAAGIPQVYVFFLRSPDD